MGHQIFLLDASTTLVPGATGSTDVAHDERAAVVGELRRTLAEAAGRGVDGRSEDLRAVELVVVAPALRPRRTDAGTADLGALGILETVTTSRPRATASVPLGQAATVAHVLLRLAGWDGPVTTLELGSGEVDPADAAVVTRTTPGSSGGLLVVFATVSTGGASSTAARRPRAALPSGAPAHLVAADAQVLALYDEALRTRETQARAVQ